MRPNFFLVKEEVLCVEHETQINNQPFPKLMSAFRKKKQYIR